MSEFPSHASIPCQVPEITTIRTKTLISSFDDLGEEQRKQKWLYPRRDVQVKFTHLSKANARTLWQFFIDRAGAYSAFNYFLALSDTYEGEYVGTGDGSTKIFNLPSKSASSYTLYVDGVSQAAGDSSGDGDYDFTAQGGADGADKIEFWTAPADGERVTFDFTGYLKIRCRYESDMLDFETMREEWRRMGVKLKGLLNA